MSALDVARARAEAAEQRAETARTDLGYALMLVGVGLSPLLVGIPIAAWGVSIQLAAARWARDHGTGNV